MTKNEIIEYLRILGRELKARGESGEILLTGGASMSLVHSARDTTKDVDALFEPKSSIVEIAKEIAKDHNINEDWLNDSVKGFVGDNAPSELFMEIDGLRINTVSAEYLLSMKLLSARYGETDYDDIDFLIKKLGIINSAGVYDLLQKYWPKQLIKPKTMYLIEEYFDSEVEKKPRSTIGAIPGGVPGCTKRGK